MICQQSGTEFHFPDLDKQLCLIQQIFEKRDRSKSNASEHQQLPSADAALRPLTLNTGLSFSYPLQFQSHVENIRNKRSFFCSHFAGCHATSSPSPSPHKRYVVPALICSVIGLEYPRGTLHNQSNAEVKLTATWSLPFSRALDTSLVFKFSLAPCNISDWLRMRIEFFALLWAVNWKSLRTH